LADGERQEGAVNFQKILLVSLSVLLVTLMVVTTALSQGIGGGLVSFSGVIETISGDLGHCY
jgi:hypothetical protein